MVFFAREMIYSFFPIYFHYGETRFLLILIDLDVKYCIYKREQAETRLKEGVHKKKDYEVHLRVFISGS